ncbi:MAG: phage portal protein, partial [Sutterella wadsworthensis]
MTSWGGPLGTASGQQIPLPVEPILDQTKNVTPDAALQISAVFACVELLAQTISTLPLYVYKEMGNGGRTPDKGRLWMLLHERPNAWMTPSEFLSAMVVNRMLRGNAYAQIIRDSEGDPIALVPLSPDQMEVSVTAGGEVYTYYQDGVISVIAPENIIHWKGLGNGYIGLSKLEYMRATADEAISAQDNASRLYGSYSKPSGVLQTDSALNDEQLSAVFERFKGMSRGGAGLYVVDRGLKYQQLSLTPADAQLLQTRQFSVEEICRWFGVPGVLVGSTATTTWGSGIQQIVEGFHKFTIGPLCKQLEQALSRRLVGVTDMDTTIEFKLDGFLRTTPEARASFYSTMAQNGAMTRNEIRRLENLPPVEGGDALTAQSNLVPIEKLGEQASTGSSPKDGTPVNKLPSFVAMSH